MILHATTFYGTSGQRDILNIMAKGFCYCSSHRYGLSIWQIYYNAAITSGDLNMLCSFFDVDVIDDMFLITEVDVECFSLNVSL